MIFMPKNVNCIYFLIILEGIKKIKTGTITSPGSFGSWVEIIAFVLKPRIATEH